MDDEINIGSRLLILTGVEGHADSGDVVRVTQMLPSYGKIIGVNMRTNGSLCLYSTEEWTTWELLA
jgi:hypothetical protein